MEWPLDEGKGRRLSTGEAKSPVDLPRVGGYTIGSVGDVP